MKIYLAGPDVFRSNAQEHFATMKAECSFYKFTGLSPFDSEAGENATALEIFRANINLLNDCDAVIANLDPFRGPNVDDGTAFEIGYAYTLGIPIYGYTIYYKETLRSLTRAYVNGLGVYTHIEDFGECRNLMIAKSIALSRGQIFGHFKDCLEALHRTQVKTINPEY